MTMNTTAMELCTTPACVRIANEMLTALAPNYTDIDPCTEFDKYVCGGWASHTEMPAGSGFIEVVTKAEQDFRWELSSLLGQSYPSEPTTAWISKTLSKEQIEIDKKNWDMLQLAYNTCMNTTASAVAGIEPLKEFVADVADSFPVDAESNKTDPEAFAKTVLKLQQYNIHTFSGLFINNDDVDPTKYMLAVGGPTFRDLSSAATSDMVKGLSGYGAALLQAVHPAKLTIEAALEMWSQVIEFQQALAVMASATLLTEPAMTIPDAPFDRSSLEDLNQMAPALQLPYVIEHLTPGAWEPANITIMQRDYLKNASIMVEQTPPALLQSFFIWRAAASLSPYVKADAAMPWNDYLDTLATKGDEFGKEARWRTCNKLLTDGPTMTAKLAKAYNPFTLGYALSRFVLESHFSEEAFNFTNEMAENIRETFGQRILEKDWLGNETKAAAKNKLDKMIKKITYPKSFPDVIDPASVASYYADLNLTDSNFGNALDLTRFAVNKSLSVLAHPVDKAMFELTNPLATNAFYSPQTNQITISLGIQQFPLFDYQFPSYLTYGGMGSIVAHEFTHGFDSNGRFFDASGAKANWWDDATAAAFEERAACFVKQFDAVTVTSPNGTEVHASGALTLAENIADSGGVATSFAAWKRSQQKAGCSQDKKLPGLEWFTDEQLFFVKWGQNWCDNRSWAWTQLALAADVHAPKEGRIKGPAVNSREFLKAFNCPKKEPVCEMW